MISICTAVKGRLDHLLQTLPLALREARASGAVYEFVVLDWDCPDESWRWLAKLNVKFEGEIKIYKACEQPYWNCPLSRNITHRLATGDVLVNLDADDCFKGKTCNLFDWLDSKEQPFVSYYRPSTNRKWPGNMGRVAVSRLEFELAQGYSTHAPHLPAGAQARLGYHDKDFVRRVAKLRGADPESWPPCSSAFIKHDNATRLRYTDLPNEKALYKAWAHTIDAIAADETLDVNETLEAIKLERIQ